MCVEDPFSQIWSHILHVVDRYGNACCLPGTPIVLSYLPGTPIVQCCSPGTPIVLCCLPGNLPGTTIKYPKKTTACILANWIVEV